MDILITQEQPAHDRKKNWKLPHSFSITYGDHTILFFTDKMEKQ